jgi:hypothetical protein
MAWWIAFILTGLCGFLFDADIAHHVPFTEFTIRQLMIGAWIGLAAGFTIHVFERSPR